MAGLPFLNTNLLLRHFTQDSPDLSPRASALMRRIEAGELLTAARAAKHSRTERSRRA